MLQQPNIEVRDRVRAIRDQLPPSGCSTPVGECRSCHERLKRSLVSIQSLVADLQATLAALDQQRQEQPSDEVQYVSADDAFAFQENSVIHENMITGGWTTGGTTS